MAETLSSIPALSSLLDQLEVAVLYFTPIFGKNNGITPVDFRIAYCNERATHSVQAPLQNLLGGTALDFPNVNDETKAELFRQLCTVYATGKPLESVLYNTRLKKYFRSKRKKIGEGVLTETKEVTVEVREQEERERQASITYQILDNALNGWVTCDPVRSEDGDIVDLVVTRVNPAYTQMIGLSAEQVVGKRYLSVFSSARDTEAFAMSRRVLESGVTERKLIFYAADGLDAWYDVLMLKVGADSLMMVFADVSIIGKAPYGVLHYQAVRDRDGRVTDFVHRMFNQVAMDLSGFSFADLSAKTVRQLCTGRNNMTLFNTAMEVMRTGTPVQLEYYASAAKKWIHFRIISYTDGVLMSFNDITERIQQEQKVGEQAALLGRIMDASLNAVFSLKAVRDASGAIVDFRFTTINQMYTNVIGKTAEEVVGRMMLDVHPLIKGTDIFTRYARVTETGQSEVFEDYYKGEGLDMWFEASVVKMEEDQIVIAFRDITGQKQARIKQESLVKELQHSNESLEEFVRAASHDLKEPVRKVLMFSDWLKSRLNGAIDESNQKLLDRIYVSTDRMRLLIDDLLEYSQASAHPKEKELINLNEKVALVLSDLELLVKEKEARITVQQLPTVRGYRRQLQQLFQNLISNALKYAKAGLPPEIRIGSRIVPGSENPDIPSVDALKAFHLIEVSDNGIGFEPEEGSRIFKIFTRLHGREYSGTGIGLSIVRRVAENHDGYVRAIGKPGEGAVLQVFLPVDED